jgi:hypothetical protein
MRFEEVKITVVFTDVQAEALAQFVKRIGWSEIRQNATGDDEADKMRDCLGVLQKALQEVGYAPR